MAQINLQSGSFSLESAGQAVRQTSVGTQLGQSGIQTGRVHAADQQQRVVIDTSTSDLLMRLGNKILEPQIKKIQTEKFLEGAQRVAQGEALKDIVDEQPWYTQIFGPSSSAQGARAVGQMKGVDDYITSVANDMPNLQKLSSKEFGKQITGKMGDFMTGDSVADAAIQMKMVEATGPLFKAHTKAHYKWSQDNMQKTTVSYYRAGTDKLKAMSAQLLNGTMTQKDYDAVTADFIGNLMPMDGQSPESYWGGIKDATLDALASGNHHAANAVFDSGVFKNAPSETRKELMDARFKYEKQTQESAGFNEYGPRIGVLKGKAAAGQLTGNEILAEVDAINADYAARYGVSRPLFQRKEMESIISGNISSIFNRAEQDKRDLAREGRADRRAAAKEQVKADMEIRKSEQLTQLIMGGAGNQAALAGYTNDEINLGVYKGAQIIQKAGGDVGKFLTMQYNNGGAHVNSLYKNQMQAGLRAAIQEGHSGAAFETSYGLFKQISKEPGGKGAALAYLGDDGVKMMKYDQFVQNRITPEVAYQLAFGQALDSSRKSTDKEIGAQLVKTVDGDQPGVWGSLFGGATLTEQSKRVLTDAVGKNYDKLASNLAMGDDDAMKVALNVAKGELDVVGSYVIPKGADRRPVYQLIGSDEKTAGTMFTELLNQKARENGITAKMPGQTKLDTLGELLTDGPVATIVGEGYKAATGKPNAGLVGTLSNASAIPTMHRIWNTVTSDEPNVMVMRLPDQNGQGMFGVTIVDTDGNMTNFPMSSGEIRAYYEKHSSFK